MNAFKRVSIQKLQQIPVFALRQLITELLESQDLEDELANRFLQVLEFKPRNVRQSLKNLNREALVKLITSCPEITEDRVNELFEDYRYGNSPSFYIFLFGNIPEEEVNLSTFRTALEAEIQEFNSPLEKEQFPRLRKILLNDLVTLPLQEDVIEGSYLFQSRLDYIDEEQNPTSVYETKYGFFWINLKKKYAMIHSSENKILRIIKSAIEKASNSHLSALVIPKTLKNHLPFLQKDSLKSGKLHDPNGSSENFRYLSFTDDNPYGKGYEELERRYPEVTDARYRTIIDEEKDTSLRIKCNTAVISLAGKIRASQFRDWCLERLDDLIRVIDAFKNNVPEYIQTRDLNSTPELAKFNVMQREKVILIISKVLEIKHQNNHLESISLGVHPLELVSKMGNLFHIQFEFECPECSTGERHILKCPTCDTSKFILREKNEKKSLLCGPGIRHPHFQFPIMMKCENNHTQTLDLKNFLEEAEFLPSSDLLSIVSEVIEKYIPGFFFDGETEFFYVSGNSIFYHKNKNPSSESEGKRDKNITSYISIQENRGHVSGIAAGQIQQ